MTGPQAPDRAAALRITRGSPDAQELAVLMAVLLTAVPGRTGVDRTAGSASAAPRPRWARKPPFREHACLSWKEDHHDVRHRQPGM
jgi:hypothetical protein